MNSLQKHLFLELFLKSHFLLLHFGYVSLSPFFTSFMLYNCLCIIIVFWFCQKNYLVKWVALHFLFYDQVEKGIHTAVFRWVGKFSTKLATCCQQYRDYSSTSHSHVQSYTKFQQDFTTIPVRMCITKMHYHLMGHTGLQFRLDFRSRLSQPL